MSLRSEERSQCRNVLYVGMNAGHRAGQCCRCCCYWSSVEKGEGGNVQRENGQREWGADCWRSADSRWRSWPVGRRSSWWRSAVLQEQASWHWSKGAVIARFVVAHTQYSAEVLFCQHNPPAHWCVSPILARAYKSVAVDVGLLNSQPFTNSRLHVHRILEKDEMRNTLQCFSEIILRGD